jgi:NTE family protein
MRALVLSGGGSRGAYEVGVLRKVMKDEKRDYDLLFGVSVGALNVAALAQTPLGKPDDAFDHLLALWESIKGDQSIFKKWPMWPFSVPFKHSVYNTQPLRDLVTAQLDQYAIRVSGRKVSVGAVSWDSGIYQDFTGEDPDFLQGVLASCAYPIMFEHVVARGEEWTDGGVRDITPISSAIAAGASEIDVIMTGNPDAPTEWTSKDRTTLKRFGRMLDLVFDEIMRTDLTVVGYKNKLANYGENYKAVNIRLMQPKTRMVEFDSLSFDPKAIKKMIEIGYKEAYVENF